MTLASSGQKRNVYHLHYVKYFLFIMYLPSYFLKGPQGPAGPPGPAGARGMVVSTFYEASGTKQWPVSKYIMLTI